VGGRNPCPDWRVLLAFAELLIEGQRCHSLAGGLAESPKGAIASSFAFKETGQYDRALSNHQRLLPVSRGGSVTAWISELKAGNHEAAQRLWERYFHRLVILARAKLWRRTALRAEDEEDVALSAFDSFCRGAAQGRFPLLQDRNNLWPLLVVITVRKLMDLLDRELAAKRGAGKVVGESALLDLLASGGGFEQVLGREPSPEFVTQVTEQCERLLGLLPEEKLRTIAILKMEAYTDREVAAKLDCGLRTVERKLERIRCIWAKEIEQ
jgi:DNA-directed RNA polymerase specialized sigma24 family protein